MLLVTESLDLIVHLFSMQCLIYLLCHNTFALVMMRRSWFYSKGTALLFPISLHCCFRKRCILVTDFAVLPLPISLYFQFPLTTKPLVILSKAKDLSTRNTPPWQLHYLSFQRHTPEIRIEIPTHPQTPTAGITLKCGTKRSRIRIRPCLNSVQSRF